MRIDGNRPAPRGAVVFLAHEFGCTYQWRQASDPPLQETTE